MRVSSLQSSSSQKSIDRGVHDSQISKEYLESVNDRYMNYLSELIEESDPKKQHDKIMASRLKQSEEMHKQNRQLLQRNTTLQIELRKSREEVNRLKTLIGQNNPGQQSSPREIESPSSQKSDPSQESQNNLNKITTEDQHQKLKGVQQMLLNARQQEKSTQQEFVKLQWFLETVFEKLNRMIEIQKLDSELKQDKQALTVSVSRQKYIKLLEFYLQANPFPYASNQNNQQKTQNQVKQFKAEEKTQVVPQSGFAPMLTPEQLEIKFSNLAQSAGLNKQWQSYLSHRQSEAQKQLAEFKSIANGQDDKEAQVKVNQSIQIIKKHKKIDANSTQMSTALFEVNNSEKEIEPVLFSKIKKLLLKLSFTQEEIDLFNRFDKKRQCGRLFDLDEFINRFKNKPDLIEISNAYTTYLVKTINFIMIKVMDVFTDSNSSQSNSNQYRFPWFINKLEKKSEKVKNNIFQALQEQFNQYLLDKNPPKQITHPMKQRKQITPIQTPIFDKEKKLESVLVKVANEYKELLNSSIFHSNREVKILF